MLLDFILLNQAQLWMQPFHKCCVALFCDPKEILVFHSLRLISIVFRKHFYSCRFSKILIWGTLCLFSVPPSLGTNRKNLKFRISRFQHCLNAFSRRSLIQTSFLSVCYVHINLRAFSSIFSWGSYLHKNVWWSFVGYPFTKGSTPSTTVVKLQNLYGNVLDKNV